MLKSSGMTDSMTLDVLNTVAGNSGVPPSFQRAAHQTALQANDTEYCAVLTFLGPDGVIEMYAECKKTMRLLPATAAAQDHVPSPLYLQDLKF